MTKTETVVEEKSTKTSEELFEEKVVNASGMINDIIKEVHKKIV
jgi:hypothetical protein